jgi:Ni,Fe-hydrogenase III large subunit
VHVGRNAVELTGAELDAAWHELREIGHDAAIAWRELEFAIPLQARLDGVGELGAEQARRLGAVGPAARASGVRHDVRSESPALWYGASFSAASLAEPSGDVGARFRIRALEIEHSLALLDELLGEPLERAAVETGAAAKPIGVARVESPRGETVCVVEAAGGRVRRMHLRTGSYANWPSVAAASAGNLLPDFPLINKSFELCYACVDR